MVAFTSIDIDKIIKKKNEDQDWHGAMAICASLMLIHWGKAGLIMAMEN